jgi:hypothetical protein
VLFVLPTAWLAGALAGRMSALSVGVPATNAAMLIALGVLVALDRRLPLAIVVGVALTCGLLNGCFNGAALASAGSSGLAVVGIGCGVFVIVALAAGQVVTLEKEWARIIVRVAGSWIGAIGLLMLGWGSLWLLPVLAICTVLVVGPLIRWLDRVTGWTWLGFTPEGARTILGAFTASMLTLVVFVVSSLLIVVQLASAQLTPRIIAVVFAPSPEMGVVRFHVRYTYDIPSRPREGSTTRRRNCRWRSRSS